MIFLVRMPVTILCVHGMENGGLPKQILYCQLCEGSCGTGRPKLRFKDTVKRNLKAKQISIGSWQNHDKQETIIGGTNGELVMMSTKN